MQKENESFRQLTEFLAVLTLFKKSSSNALLLLISLEYCTMLFWLKCDNFLVLEESHSSIEWRPSQLLTLVL